MLTRCGHCQVFLQVEDKLAGELGRCPSCKNAIRLPYDKQSVAELMRYELDPSQIPIAQRVLATALMGTETVNLPESTLRSPGTGQSPPAPPPSAPPAAPTPAPAPVEELDTSTQQDIRAAIQEGLKDALSEPAAKTTALKNPDGSGFFDVDKSLNEKPSPQPVGISFKPGMLAAAAEGGILPPADLIGQRILVICSKCKKTLGIAGDLAGQLGMCPSCKAVLIIPYHDGTIPEIKQATRNTALYQRTHGSPSGAGVVIPHARRSPETPGAAGSAAHRGGPDSSGLQIVSEGIKETMIQPGLQPATAQGVTTSMVVTATAGPAPVEPPPPVPTPAEGPAAPLVPPPPTPTTAGGTAPAGTGPTMPMPTGSAPIESPIKKPIPLGIVIGIAAACLAGGLAIGLYVTRTKAPSTPAIIPPQIPATPVSLATAGSVMRETPAVPTPAVALIPSTAAPATAPATPVPAVPVPVMANAGGTGLSVKFEAAKSGVFAIQNLSPAPSGQRWLFLTCQFTAPGPNPSRLTPGDPANPQAPGELWLELPDGKTTPWQGQLRPEENYDAFSGQSPLNREPLIVEAKTSPLTSTLAFLVPEGITSAQLFVKGAEPVVLSLAKVMPEDDTGDKGPVGNWEMEASQIKKSRYAEPVIEAVVRQFKQKLNVRSQTDSEMLLVDAPGAHVTGIAVPSPRGKGYYQMNLRAESGSVQATARLIDGGKRLLVSFADKDLYQFTFDRIP